MKRIILLLAIFFATLNVNATESTDFLAKVLTEKCGKKVKVVSKKEFITEYQQKYGDKYVHAIAYGAGYIKPRCERKTWISYLCLLDADCNPIWGEINEQNFDDFWCFLY